MQRTTGRLVRGLSGALVVGALTFGATQAFASPRNGYAAPGQTCFEYCTERWGWGTQPIYYHFDGYQWYCGCIL